MTFLYLFDFQARLILICVFGPINIVMGLTIAKQYHESKNLIFRTVGANVMLQELCNGVFRTESLLKFDLQLTVSVGWTWVCCCVSWVTHGCHMGYAWMSHGLHMDVTLVTHGCHMRYAWMSHGLCMDITWVTHGCHMGYTWMSHGLRMDVTWVTHGCHMGYTWMSHEVRMDVTWVTHGCHMGYT